MAVDRDQPTVSLRGGDELPLVGFGTWQMTGSECYRAVRHALDVGYRHVDTATLYENEHEVGRALKDSGVAREAVFLTTKLNPRHAGREQKSIEASLRALGTDYLDLWLIHWPQRGAAPQVWKQFLVSRDEGLIRAAGVSNYSTSQMDELERATGELPEVNQIRWGPALHDPDEVDEHRKRGVVVEGYSPFKSTDLRARNLKEIADRHGVTTAQVIVRWHIQHEIVVIPKSATPERISANFDVFDFSLDDEEMSRIDGMSDAVRL